MVMLGKEGLINNLLITAGLIDKPLQMLYTDGAVYLGIVYSYLPFMILPLYATLEKLDLDLHEAAADLGARPSQVFRDVTLPLAFPGIVAGCLLVFIPALGEYVIPALLGGLDSLMIGRTLYDEFFVNRDWPLASAVAVVLLLILILPIMLFQRLQQETEV
jgi:putrescine transport system permease protein